ncbi:4311_t:CDS:2 [Ambispora gerdemannii]|uniref:4311_t:CDS:1 n=1 Tax=Ambispora gerdemannii TaxID=144530 RepID=A0A9N8WIV8_9GLOM|nr:4311_t:CDS:2 [Ambispora gerdemannii]
MNTELPQGWKQMHDPRKNPELAIPQQQPVYPAAKPYSEPIGTLQVNALSPSHQYPAQPQIHQGSNTSSPSSGPGNAETGDRGLNSGERGLISSKKLIKIGTKIFKSMGKPNKPQQQQHSQQVYPPSNYYQPNNYYYQSDYSDGSQYYDSNLMDNTDSMYPMDNNNNNNYYIDNFQTENSYASTPYYNESNSYYYEY